MKASRRHERGAVLVEAAVVIPSFVLLFGGMLFLHHVVREQQRVGAQAKNEAWVYAMASCQGGGNGLPQVPFTSQMPGAPGAGITLTDSLGQSDSSASNFVAVSILGNGPAPVAEGNGLFAFSQTVAAHDSVYCNNQTAAGDIGGVFDWLVSSVKGLFGW
jgi:hypothetical protein